MGKTAHPCGARLSACRRLSSRRSSDANNSCVPHRHRRQQVQAHRGDELRARKYARLANRILVKAIETEEEHDDMAAAVEQLIGKGEDEQPRTCCRCSARAAERSSPPPAARNRRLTGRRHRLPHHTAQKYVRVFRKSSTWRADTCRRWPRTSGKPGKSGKGWKPNSQL